MDRFFLKIIDLVLKEAYKKLYIIAIYCSWHYSKLFSVCEITLNSAIVMNTFNKMNLCVWSRNSLHCTLKISFQIL